MKMTDLKHKLSNILFIQFMEAHFCEQIGINIKTEFKEFKQWYFNTDNIPLYINEKELSACYKRFCQEKYREKMVKWTIEELNNSVPNMEEYNDISEKIVDISNWGDGESKHKQRIDNIIICIGSVVNGGYCL